MPQLESSSVLHRIPFVNLLKSLLLDYFVWLLVILLLVIAGIATPRFYSLNSLMNFLLHSVVLGLFVLAESLCLITGNFDLSIESILIFTAVIAGWIIIPNSVVPSLIVVNPIIGIFIMLVIGALIGAINGILIAYLKLNAFIVTLAISLILSGLAIFITMTES